MDIFTPQLAKVVDPEIDLQQKKIFPIIKGAVLFTPRVFNADSTSSTFTHFNVNPPSPTTFVSRRFLLTLDIAVNLSIVAGVSSAVCAECIRLRPLPLLSMMRTLEIVINGQSININPEEICKPIAYYKPDIDRQHNTTSNKWLDTIADLYSAIGIVTPGQNGGILGFGGTTRLNHQLGGHVQPDYVGVSVLGNPGNQTLHYTLQEELMIPPLYFNSDAEEAFIGIQKLDVNITWNSSLLNAFEIFQKAGVRYYDINNITISNPQMTFYYKTPPMNITIPPYIQYPFHEWRDYITTISGAATGNNNLLVDVGAGNPGVVAGPRALSQNIQLNCIPKFLYIYIRERYSDRVNSLVNTPVWVGTAAAQLSSAFPAYRKTDAFGIFSNLSVNWNNETSLLRECTERELYDISRKNGYGYPYFCHGGDYVIANAPGTHIQANHYQPVCRGNGTIMCLEFGTDIALKEYEAPGLIGTYNLQVTVDWWNPTSMTWTNPELHLVTCMPGIFTIYNNSASKRIGVVDVNDIMNVGRMTGIDWWKIHDRNLMGGLRFKSLLKKSAKYAKALGRAAAPAVGKYASKAFGEQGAKAIMPIYNRVVRKSGNKGAMKQPGAQMEGSAFVGGRRRRKPGPKKKKVSASKRGRKKGSAFVGGRRRRAAVVQLRSNKRGGKMVNKRDLARLIKNL